jgi:hypothetical protein
MHRIEGFPAALDIKADGVDGTVGAEESALSDKTSRLRPRHVVSKPGQPAATVVSSRISAFVVAGPASTWDADPTRSGWRDAARTWNLWLSRCRTIRRPRNPVPPKTVMSPRWPAVLCVGSSAMAVSRHAHWHNLSRASPHEAERLTSACSGVPQCQRASRRMNVERRADNRPDAEPARGFERRAGLKPERGSVEEVPRNRKGSLEERCPSYGGPTVRILLPPPVSLSQQ